MKLWLVNRTDAGYGEYVGFVIRAACELDARRIASMYAFSGSAEDSWGVVADPVRNLWFAPETLVTEIAIEGDP